MGWINWLKISHKNLLQTPQWHLFPHKQEIYWPCEGRSCATKHESTTKISGSTSAFIWDTRHQPIVQWRAVIFHNKGKLKYTASETQNPHSPHSFIYHWRYTVLANRSVAKWNSSLCPTTGLITKSSRACCGAARKTRMNLNGVGLMSWMKPVITKVQNGSGAHPATYSVGTGVLSRGKLPESNVDYSPSNAEVMNEWSNDTVPPTRLRGVQGSKFSFVFPEC